MIKRSVLNNVEIIFILGFTAVGMVSAELPSATELVDKYTHALDSTSSFIEEFQKTVTSSARMSMGTDTSVASYRGQYRYDLNSQCMYFQEYGWGKLGRSVYDEDNPNYTLGVQGKSNYSHFEVIGGRPGKARRHSRPEGQKVSHPLGVSYLTGFIGSGDERLDNVLRSAKNISVRRQTEKVGDSECFVLEADTKHGQYKLWLDPEHGYHPARILNKASEGDYSFNHLMAKGDTAKAYLKNVRFEKIDGVWVPMEADSHSDLRNAQGCFSADDYHYKRTKIILNPDHEKLGSFDDPLENPSNDPELKNGTRVLLHNVPIVYIWQDGELIPNIDGIAIDEIDKMTDEILAEENK